MKKLLIVVLGFMSIGLVGCGSVTHSVDQIIFKNSIEDENIVVNITDVNLEEPISFSKQGFQDVDGSDIEDYSLTAYTLNEEKAVTIKVELVIDGKTVYESTETLNFKGEKTYEYTISKTSDGVYALSK